jgi:hypothetical protein
MYTFNTVILIRKIVKIAVLFPMKMKKFDFVRVVVRFNFALNFVQIMLQNVVFMEKNAW